MRVDPKNTNCTVVIEDDSVLSAQEIFFTCTPQNTVGKKVMIAVDSQKRKLVEVLDVNNENKILLDDYITLHNVVIALYARNLFCANGNWQK